MALARSVVRPSFVAVLLSDPHLLAGGQQGQDAAFYPYAVLALGRRHKLHLDRGVRLGRQLLGQPRVDVGETWSFRLSAPCCCTGHA